MDLRSHKYYHFIHAIKGGSIERVLNVDTCGRPKLIYKDLEDVYEKERLKHGETLTQIQPKVVRVLNHVPDVADDSCMLAAEVKVKSDPKDCTVKSDGSVQERDEICVELGSCDMTIGQILKQCRANTSKHQNGGHIEIGNSDLGIKQEHFTLEPEEPLCKWKIRCSQRRNDLSIFHDVMLDVWEDCYPVSESMTCILFDPSPDCIEVPKASPMESFRIPRTTKPMEEAIKDVSNEFYNKLRQAECCAKVAQENTGPHYALNSSIPGDETTRLAGNSGKTCRQQQGECCVQEFGIQNQEHTGSENALDISIFGEGITWLNHNSEVTGLLNSDFSMEESGNVGRLDKPVSTKTSLETEESYESGESVDPTPHLGTMVTGWEIVKVESPQILTIDLPILDLHGGNPYRLADKLEGTDMQNSDFFIAESGNYGCVKNPFSSESLEIEEAYECREGTDPKHDLCMKITSSEIVNVQTPELLTVDYTGAFFSSFSKTNCLERNNHLERNLLICSGNYLSMSEGPGIQVKEPDVDRTGHFLDYCDSRNAESSCEMEGVGKNYLSNTPEVGHGLQKWDLRNAGNSCETEDIATDYLHDTPQADHSFSCSCGSEGIATVDFPDTFEFNYDMPDTSEVTYSRKSSHSCLDNCMISVDEDHLLEERGSTLCEHVETAGQCKSTRSSRPSKADRVHQRNIHHHPEKLFSWRKVISPTSQARLCKAIDHLGSPEKMSNKCKEKLYFGSQNAHRILNAKGLDDIEKIRATPNWKQAVQKPNIFRKNASLSSFSRQNRQASMPPRRFSTGCNSIQLCSQNAIAFSQQQMHDIQNVATKLTDELNSMKEITKRCLQIEYSPSKPLKHKVDEVKIAIQNAKRAQETARKWLSIMERDCNRFCKLMGMNSKNSPVTENISRKKRKRVTFADHAGGDLCQVKFC